MSSPQVVTTPVEPLEVTGSLDEVRQAAAASTIQRLVRVRRARRHLRELLISVVGKFFDDESGQYYYHNSRTGETTWDKPRILSATGDLAVSGVYAEQASTDLVTSLDGTVGSGGNDDEEEDDDEEEEEEKEGDGEEEEEDDDDEEEDDEDEEGDGEEEQREVKEERDALGYTANERALVQKQFEHYDTDHSGSISAAELMKLLQSLGEPVSLQNVKDLIQQVDANGNGEVELDEFLAILRRQQDKNQYSASLELALRFGPTELANLKKQFMRLDLDGSGSIDEHEIRALIAKLGRSAADYDLPAMLREVDADGSGSIGFNEFLQIVSSMMEQSRAKHGKSGFAALLDLGIAQGLLNELGDVMAQSGIKLFEWWNADMIAEKKRLAVKRERRRKAEEERQRQADLDRAAYAEHEARVAAEIAARRAPVDGLLHEIEFKGDGTNYPSPGQYARVHYTGMFASNNHEFESTRRRGSALEFCVGAGHVIQGFDLALQRMSVGETARLTMAPMLAYGVKGRPPKIPPNATLIFKIELISIKEKLHLASRGGPLD